MFKSGIYHDRKHINDFVNDLVENCREEIIDFTRELVRIPTVNTPPNGNELPGQIFFEKACLDIGLEAARFTPSEIDGYECCDCFLKERDFKDRFNVVGTWYGTESGRKLLFSGHMDVAPREPLPWTVCEPFEGMIHNGRLYGRGSADMKSGLAAAFMAVKLLKMRGWQPKGDVIVESVVDEEFAGANGTIASRLKGYNADFAINPEPTGLVVFPACVGALILKITIKGTAGMPYTDNEIYNPAYGIAEIVHILKEYEEYRNEKDPVPDLWKKSSRKRQVILTKLKAGEVNDHGQLGLPVDAWLEVIIQTFPGETEESSYNEFMNFLDRHMEKTPGLSVHRPVVEKEYRYMEPGTCDINNEGLKTLISCVSDVMDEPVEIMGAPFSCDLFAFEKYGKTPAAVFGPVGGNLHAPDEWVDIESIIAVTRIFIMMLMDWNG